MNFGEKIHNDIHRKTIVFTKYILTITAILFNNVLSLVTFGCTLCIQFNLWLIAARETLQG
ncbi:hypothetical protein WQ54_26080 [Bacillus sp. SA1-12]|uniref:hypothetical protein n=1 Tax=Bacillus sp. SA1-12 TaxID=1455638 RepID=UPI0006272CAB|nr:hypothetical protein [Bacillus sp. SA1-12]KKI89350.1 hypothetical protein WQ54_26080 [Bacillus sp. SA1-12]